MEEGKKGGWRRGERTGRGRRQGGMEGGKGTGKRGGEGGRERGRDRDVCSEKLRGAVSCGKSPFKMSLEQGHTYHPPPRLHPNGEQMKASM